MNKDDLKRYQHTVSCKDTDSIPKVYNAGHTITLEGKDFQVMHNGILVLKDKHYGEFNIRIIEKLKGHHEPQEEKVFYEFLKEIKPNSTMLELGSFWGYYSMWFNMEVKNAVNFLIEPIFEVLEIGINNFTANKLNGNFLQGSIGETSIDNVNFNHWDGSTHIVNQYTVDELFKNQNLDHLDILHADIQGAEYKMLLGATNSLTKKKIGYLFVSTHSDSLHRLCIKVLKNHKYQIIISIYPFESFSVDGFIYATNPAYENQRKNYITRVKISPYKRMRLLLKARLKADWIHISHHCQNLFKNITHC